MRKLRDIDDYFWYTGITGGDFRRSEFLCRTRAIIARFHLRTQPIRRILFQGALPATLCLAFTAPAWSQTTQPLPWSQRVANSTMSRWLAGRFVAPNANWKWNYELGVLLNGMDATWYTTADGQDYHYIQTAIDQLITPDGAIPTYDPAAKELDNLALGPQLLMLYRVTQKKKYYEAAALLRRQLQAQPRNASGGFWHKQKYPNQMWLDGLYMAEPFYAEYASLFHEPNDFADITKQFVLMDQHARSPKTGLLYHGWDESKQQPWADKTTGDSPLFWARGMGWYMMALVDTLPYYPENDPGRAKLLSILNQTAAALVRVQDSQTGLWYQVLDKPNAPGNYFESSADCMFVYALQKGVRLGYLPRHYSKNASRAWQGILTHFVQAEPNGSITVTGTVKGIGLSPRLSRDEAYSYYVHSPVVSNDPKGVGAFLLAATEMEMAPKATLAHGKTIMVDAWFNSQQRTNAAGQKEYFHYKWKDFSSSGFSLLGHIFQSHGASLAMLSEPPTLARLRHAQVYFIISPDIPKWNPHPHYVQPRDAHQVAAWVKQGGVLVLMENDPANADIEHFNLIAGRFGIHFDNVLQHHIIDDHFEPGFIPVSGAGSVFHTPHTLYMKDTCGLSVKSPATAVLSDQQGIVIATAKYGRGTVVAVADPWLYNEYTDHRKVRPEQENFAAGKEFVLWLLNQTERGARAPSR